MNEVDRQKIEQIISDRNQAHAYYNKRSKVYRSFIEMENATYVTDKLGRMEKELIAVGISVVLNCESCMEWHIKMAFDNGADNDQILEAIGVGIEMGGGPATVAGRFAMKILEFYGGEN